MGWTAAACLSGTKKAISGDSGSGWFANVCAGPSCLSTDRPVSPHLPVASPPHCPRSAPTRCRVRFKEDSEVDDPRCEVEGCLLAIVDH